MINRPYKLNSRKKNMEEEFLGAKEAAEYLGVCTVTLKRWERAGHINPRRNTINNYRRYSKRELDLLKAQNYLGKKEKKHGSIKELSQRS